MKSKIYIYANNSVDIGGKAVYWTEKDFKVHKIPMVRPAQILNEEDNGIKKTTDKLSFVVFPTIFREGRKLRKKLDIKTKGASEEYNKAMKVKRDSFHQKVFEAKKAFDEVVREQRNIFNEIERMAQKDFEKEIVTIWEKLV